MAGDDRSTWRVVSAEEAQAMHLPETTEAIPSPVLWREWDIRRRIFHRHEWLVYPRPPLKSGYRYAELIPRNEEEASDNWPDARRMKLVAILWPTARPVE